MPLINLKTILFELSLSQTSLARYLDISTGSVSLILKHNRWPKLRNGGKHALRDRIASYLLQHGVPPEKVATAFEEAPEPRSNAARASEANASTPSPLTDTNQPEDKHMLLRKHTINKQAKAHFRISRDPFTDEMESDADVFVSDDIRYVRASMRQTAKHGGMLAVIAESGGGKSTLRHDLIDWINTSGEPITVIEPYVLGMEATDKKGKALKSVDITGAVIRAVSPGVGLRASASDRAGQMHDMLKASAQIGRKHVLIIEEAHGLATPTLKHLKRFYELQDGFRKLLAIILIGQTELSWKLSEHNPEVREVVQRCEVVNLPPLDNHVEAYLRHKFSRVDMDFDVIMAPDAVDEIRNRLQHAVSENSRGQRATRMVSLCHPLAINNLVSAAINEAVKIGAPKITGGLIAAAVRSA